MPNPSDRTVLAAFFTGSVFAGGNAVAVRFSNRELDALWGAGLRFAVAAVLMAVVMLAMRQRVPRGRALAGAILFGALNFGGSFAFAYYALIRLHAGFGQTLLALVPLMTLLLAVLHRQERFRVGALVGGVIALAGVAFMTGLSVEAQVPVSAVLASLASALCFAEAAVVARGLKKLHPVTLNAVGMAAGAVLLLVGAVVAGDTLTLPRLAATWAALAYVVVFGSVVVFALYVFVLRNWPASRAAYGFVVIPFVTVLLSAWLDDERVGWSLVVGGLLVIAGVYVGALRRAAATEPGG